MLHDDHLLASVTRVGALTAMGQGLGALLSNPWLGGALTLLGAAAWEVARPVLRHVGEHLLASWKRRRASTLPPPPPPPAPTPDPET